MKNEILLRIYLIFFFVILGLSLSDVANSIDGFNPILSTISGLCLGLPIGYFGTDIYNKLRD